MAVAAETLSPERYIPVDHISPVAEARQVVRAEAWAVVRQREQQLTAGEEVVIPLPIDALSTAYDVIEAEEWFGLASPVYLDRLAGLELDCRRLVAEWFRKLKPEYFAPSRHFFDAETGDFYSHGLSIRQMTENALRPISGNPEEVARRVNERVENETPQIVRKLGGFALNQVGIRTLSELSLIHI